MAPSRQRWATLIVISAGTALLLLDVTAVNVALPAIRADLDASFAELQWVIDNTFRQFGIAAGIAALGAILTAQTSLAWPLLGDLRTQPAAP